MTWCSVKNNILNYLPNLILLKLEYSPELLPNDSKLCTSFKVRDHEAVNKLLSIEMPMAKAVLHFCEHLGF